MQKSFSDLTKQIGVTRTTAMLLGQGLGAWLGLPLNTWTSGSWSGACFNSMHMHVSWDKASVLQKEA
jgi:hypothetical protein